jgi:L-fuconolactonase
VKVIDSHVHFWDPKHLRYDWLQGTSLYRPFLPDDYRQAIGDITVEGIVFVEVDRAPEQGLAEAQWIDSLPAPIKGIVAFAPLELGNAARPALDALASIPKVKAIRRLIQSEGAGFAAQPLFIEGVRLLAEYQLRFDICIKYHQLPDVLTLVEQCPGVQFVLDHIGKPDIAGGEINQWRQNTARLAQFENAYCKLSGLVTEADHANWKPADLQPYVEHVLEVFGTQRLMFGSDWPVCTWASTYARWYETIRQFLDPLPNIQKQAIFADNAIRFYGLNA